MTFWQSVAFVSACSVALLFLMVVVASARISSVISREEENLGLRR